MEEVEEWRAMNTNEACLDGVEDCMSIRGAA